MVIALRVVHRIQHVVIALRVVHRIQHVVIALRVVIEYSMW